MKQLIKVALLGALCFAFNKSSFAQGECLAGGCSSAGTQWPTGAPLSTTSSTFTTVATNNYAGDYGLYNVTLGSTYEWSLCAVDGGSCPYDGQLTLYNNASLGVAICYSDDFCAGLDPKIQWTATFTGVVRVKINEFSGGVCITNTTNTTTRWRCASCAVAACTNDNCSGAIPLATTGVTYCGNNSCGTLTGTGDFSMSCGFGLDPVQGAVWFSFVAPASGSVTISTSYAGTTFDTQINLLGDLAGVASSCPAIMYEYGCDEDGGALPLTSEIVVGGLMAGQTYWIQLDGYAGATGNYCISVATNVCSANVGTFNAAVNGVPTPISTPVYLCYGVDCYTVTSNNNFTLPIPNCLISELMYAIYTAAPTVTDPNLDPAWTGYFWTGKDFSDCNNAASVFNTVPTLTGFTTYWLVPITVDDGDDDGLAPSVPGPCPGLGVDLNGDGCFDVGAPIEMHYLNAIVAVGSMNSCTGVATITVTGGLPQDNGSNYTIVNTGPGVLTGTPITNGGSVTVSGLANGQTVSLTITDGKGCSKLFTFGPVSVTTPSTSAAGPDQAICASPGSITMAGNVPAVGTGAWTLVSGPSAVTITTPSSATTTVTGLTTAGTYIFQWTISNGGCPPSTDQISVVVTGTPTVSNAGPDQTICTTTGSATLAGNAPATGTGTWTQVSGPVSTITTPSSPTSTVTGLGTAGTYVYQWTIANAPCASSTDQVSIIVNAPPTVANAGPDQTICSTSSTVTMAGNAPAVGAGTWTKVSGPAGGAITTPGSPTTTITGLIAGTYVYQWTITNAPCAATSDQVSIIVNAPPTVSNAGPPQTICSTSGTVTMAGNTPGVGAGTWTQSSGPVAGTITTPSSPTTTVTGLTTAGSYVFVWTIANAPCANSTSSVTITVNAPPTTANAGPPQSICSSSGTVTMAGNAPGVGAGTWTYISGPVTGTITTPSSPTTTITGLTTPGTYVYQWTIANAPCANSTSTVTITVNAPPTTANAGPPQTICSSSVTMAGNAAGVGTGGWTEVSGPVLGTITTPTSPTTTITGLTIAGTYVFQWSILNPPCAPSTSTVTITVNAAPTTANAGPPQTICSTSGSVTMAGNAAVVGSGTWTYVSGPVAGTITTPSSPTTTITGLTTPGTYVYQWSITNAPCAASTSTVTITVNAPPTASNAGTNQTICVTSGSATMAGNVPAVGAGAWSQVSGPVIATITTPSSPTTNISGMSTAGTYVFQWTIINAPCASSSSTVTITVNPTPTIANSGAPQTICSTPGSVTMAGNVAVTGAGTWSQISGPVIGTITTPGSPTTTITGLTTAGAYVFQWSITNPPCTPSTSNVTITVNPAPTTSAAGPNQTICSSAGSVTMAGNAPTAGTGTWSQVSGPVTGTITTPGAPNTSITGLTTAGTYVFQWTISNAPCTSSSSTVSITVNPNPVFAIGTIVNPSACGAADGSITLSGLNASTVYTITYNNGSTISLGSVTTTAGGTYVITGLSSGTYSTFVVTNSFGCSTTVAGPASLVDPSAPTGTAGTSFTNPSGCGATDGTITVGGLTPGGTYDISYSLGATIVTVTGVTADGSGNIVLTGLGAGTYSGFSLTQAGCTGTATGSVTLSDPPSPTYTAGSSSSNPTTCGGTNGTITITGLNGSTTYSITYTGPLGTVTISGTTTAGGTYVITGLTAGTYNGFVISLSGCSGTSGASITLTDPAAPSYVPGSSSLNPTTCGGSDGFITIGGLNPSTTYVISYEGPSGVVLLGSVTTDASGNYVITGLPSGTYFNFSVSNPVTGCTTIDAISSVNLTDPGAPTFTVTGSGTNPTGCGVSDGTFSITGLNPFTTYNFIYDNGSVVTVTGTTDAFGNYTVTGLPAGTYTNISVSLAGCTSVNSTIITLVDPPSPTFTAGSTFTDPTICGGSDGTITVSGLNPTTTYDISYFDGTSTVTLTGITTDASGNYVITGLPAGAYTSITVTLTGCSGVSPSTVTLTDPGIPTTFVIAGTNPSCSGNDGIISITGLNPTTTYNVTYDDGSGPVTVTLTTNASGQIDITALGGGTYSGFVISTGVCSANPVTTVTLTTPLPQTALAGADQNICGISTTMAGNAVTAGTGTWTVFGGTGIFANANSETTGVTGLTTGTNIFVWTIVNGSCPVSSDTVTVTSETPPTTAALASDQTICDSVNSFVVVGNTPVVGSGVWTLTTGTATLTNPSPDSLILTGINGAVTVTWTISGTGICPPSSDAITITPESCVNLNVGTGFTPDGDGVNDYWEIPGLIENYPNNRVEIFTRWGAKIFSMDKYSNQWDGKYKNNPMPLGAYYFVIYFNDGATDPMKGTVTIIR